MKTSFSVDGLYCVLERWLAISFRLHLPETYALCEIAENAKKAIFNVRAIVQSKHAANVRNDD